MKKIFLFLLFLTILKALNLTVIVTGLKNNKGKLQVSLYNKDGTIPDKNQNKYYKTKRISIKNKKAKVIFTNLPVGTYAVSVYHDENNNHKLDMGLFMPKEGVGLSKFDKINLFNLPNFQKASFFLKSNQTIFIKVIYF